jgi:hypothetical protein
MSLGGQSYKIKPSPCTYFKECSETKWKNLKMNWKKIKMKWNI